MLAYASTAKAARPSIWPERFKGSNPLVNTMSTEDNPRPKIRLRDLG